MHSKPQTFIIAFLLNIVFVLISTPWEFGHTYFGDSKIAWIIYYVIGFAFSLYVTWAFLRALKLLLNHIGHHLKEENHE